MVASLLTPSGRHHTIESQISHASRGKLKILSDNRDLWDEVSQLFILNSKYGLSWES